MTRQRRWREGLIRRKRRRWSFRRWWSRRAPVPALMIRATFGSLIKLYIFRYSKNKMDGGLGSLWFYCVFFLSW
ncbi:hypothetical protein QJS04_geneDACA010406 [Acorus gramineus]|uniref:Uncharacterized protein n=1 Tax=Acorus gramineus TaxID=55184 RepID=A0AAV9A623_ACOGR|nr:hypothetical protein QJS04_geneDACA010406 [Acorus gramineus]